MKALSVIPVQRDIVCFSHLRWNFVFQRPQHLMTRFARSTRVYYIEEVIRDAAVDACLEIKKIAPNLQVVTPHVQRDWGFMEANQWLSVCLERLFGEQGVDGFVGWYYTPMALYYSKHLRPAITVYDCMDELSAFKFAPSEMKEKEGELLQTAQVVFTGGRSLYEVKRDLHPNVHLCLSSVDKEHFAKARTLRPDLTAEVPISRPRFGFSGVLDERLDIPLVAALADARPEWNFVFIGPVAKISEQSLPKAKNIHYLGMKDYGQLPDYISHWDIAILPFALNEATRFISPTKTPEYLAAGKPVISTPICDIIHTYGETGLIHIAHDAASFIASAEKILREGPGDRWLSRVDEYLSQISWDHTWAIMTSIINREQARQYRSIAIKG